MAEMGEFVAGAYLRLIRDCEIVTYNQRLSREPGAMGEADVLGIDVDGPTVYLCEVATHLNGLNYGKGNQETLERLTQKFSRIASYAHQIFPSHGRCLMLWSPYVPKGYLTEGLDALQTKLGQEGHGLELHINDKYAESVKELSQLARRVTKDYGEPFFRALQILTHLRPHERTGLL